MPRSLSTRSACRDKRSPVTSVNLTSVNRCLFTDALQFLCCVLGWAAPRPLGSFPSLTPGDRQFPARDEPLQSFFPQFAQTGSVKPSLRRACNQPRRIKNGDSPCDESPAARVLHCQTPPHQLHYVWDVPRCHRPSPSPSPALPSQERVGNRRRWRPIYNVEWTGLSHTSRS
jgi:hypothetical protein